MSDADNLLLGRKRPKQEPFSWLTPLLAHSMRKEIDRALKHSPERVLRKHRQHLDKASRYPALYELLQECAKRDAQELYSSYGVALERTMEWEAIVEHYYKMRVFHTQRKEEMREMSSEEVLDIAFHKDTFGNLGSTLSYQMISQELPLIQNIIVMWAKEETHSAVTRKIEQLMREEIISHLTGPYVWLRLTSPMSARAVVSPSPQFHLTDSPLSFEVREGVEKIGEVETVCGQKRDDLSLCSVGEWDRHLSRSREFLCPECLKANGGHPLIGAWQEKNVYLEEWQDDPKGAHWAASSRSHGELAVAIDGVIISYKQEVLAGANTLTPQPNAPFKKRVPVLEPPRQGLAYDLSTEKMAAALLRDLKERNGDVFSHFKPEQDSDPTPLLARVDHEKALELVRNILKKDARIVSDPIARQIRDLYSARSSQS